MAWIESNQEIGRHPKTKKLARKLGISIPAAIGHLHLLWWWAIDYAPDGNLSKFEPDDIADALIWEGDSLLLLEALIEAGWIERQPNAGIMIHDWDEYAGRLVDKREQNRERKKKSRARHAPVTRDGGEGHGATQHNPTEPNQTEQNQDQTATAREEPFDDPPEGLPPAIQIDPPQAITSITDAHTQVFGNPIMTPLMSDYIRKLMKKGKPEQFVIELILESGESGNRPSLRHIQTIEKRWIAEGIMTREQAKKRGAPPSTGPPSNPSTRYEKQMSEIDRQIQEEEKREQSRGAPVI